MRHKTVIDNIMRPKVPALRASRLIKTIATTPLRAWLLNLGPSGLSTGTTLCTTISNSPASNFYKA